MKLVSTRKTQNASNVREELGAQLRQAPVQTVLMAGHLLQDQTMQRIALVSAF